jgi:hypothetical protein
MAITPIGFPCVVNEPFLDRPMEPLVPPALADRTATL